MHPYDEIQCECWWQGLGAVQHPDLRDAARLRHRPAGGQRLPLHLADPRAARGPRGRAAAFGERAGHYYDNWDAIYEEWKVKTVDRLEQMKAMRFAPLPALEELEVVTSHRGSSSGYR
jgi:pyruvate,water dikinase